MFKTVIMLQNKHTMPFMLNDFVVIIHFRVEFQYSFNDIFQPTIEINPI